ncbi:MAG: TraR/DksA C4-type zinc finger protein [Proteobacteria bacterium]|nr:TraR/DksA C4-type zinc finger protein [Pseudomonadota bacterium]
MDLFDRASELEQLQRDGAIAHTRKNAPHGISATECEDCGAAIPAARQAAALGCIRCISCQTIFEKGQA